MHLISINIWFILSLQVNSAGIIITIAGSNISSLSGDGGGATAAALKNPSGLALTTLGDLLIADFANHRIRMVCVCAAFNHILAGIVT